MKYTPSGPDRSVQATRDRLVRYREHQETYGFSKWLIVDRKAGRAVGDAGLLVLEKQGWTDLGFRLARSSWGHGLATEASGAWVRAAFTILGIHRLGAFAHPGNSASIRVLEKLGFLREQEGTIMGMTSIYFTLEASIGGRRT